mmetsp:Transcript_30154/g.104205  ORF Transcript_30154/g.104205 Transcript_30154/m.104205 type:complete len:171 (+) Transcript_30154:2218-2730(+)
MHDARRAVPNDSPELIHAPDHRPDALAAVHAGAGVQPKVVVPDGSTKRLPDAPEKPAVELKGFAKMRALIREHGFSFIALYTGGYFVTYVPIFAALQVGGVNGPELCISAAEWMQLSYDITWIRDSTISKELVNAFIAAELNGWLEVVRLPLVVVSAPKMTAWIAKQRGP